MPWSGGTGLVGGQIASENIMTLSMERMNKIKNFSAINRSIEVEAKDFEVAQWICRKENFIYPLSMASKGSCCVGGNLATNAGE